MKIVKEIKKLCCNLFWDCNFFHNTDVIEEYPIESAPTPTATPELARRGHGNKIRISMVDDDVEDSGIEAGDIRSFSANKNDSISLDSV